MNNFMSNPSEICCICGHGVSHLTSLFVNRVPECNDYDTKVEMGRKFPEGEWVCIVCDNTDSDGVVLNLDEVEFSIESSEDALRVFELFLGTMKECKW